MNIKGYIESGILEIYVLGSASETEAKELLRLKEQYPEIQNALYQLELDMEHIAQHMAINPPPGIKKKVIDSINDLIINQPKLLSTIPGKANSNDAGNSKQDKYIEIESETTHMRVHKTWKWVFAAVFILSKIFLIAAIYFYLEYRQAQRQIQELKTELIHSQRP